MDQRLDSALTRWQLLVLLARVNTGSIEPVHNLCVRIAPSILLFQTHWTELKIDFHCLDSRPFPALGISLHVSIDVDC